MQKKNIMRILCPLKIVTPKIEFSKFKTKSPILILESIPKIRNPPLAKIVTFVKIVTFFKIVTPFSASRKCHYNEWTQ